MNEFIRERAEEKTYLDLLGTARNPDIKEKHFARRVVFCYRMDLISYEMIEKIAEVFISAHPERHEE